MGDSGSGDLGNRKKGRHIQRARPFFCQAFPEEKDEFMYWICRPTCNRTEETLALLAIRILLKLSMHRQCALKVTLGDEFIKYALLTSILTMVFNVY
jgi:hypothetical protein